ncbi:MAG: LytTR family DNA-binding domain-containing protein [Chitinophagaceae bacterium]
MIRCIVIDDEPLSIELLEDYIGKVPFLTHVASYTNPIEAFNNLDGIDLVFSDIQMPELTGLQLVQLLKGKVQIIFTTAYSEYAVQGFEHDVADYLVKPFSFERFLKAVKKVQTLLNGGTVKEPQSNAPVSFADMGFLFIKTSHKMVRVSLNEVLLVEGVKDYIAFVTITEKILSLQRMKYAEETLPAANFIRVHKSYIVALDKIDSIERNRLFVGEHVVPIGETYRQQFFDRIGWREA